MTATSAVVAPTKTDPTAEPWSFGDELVRLREWGTDRVYALPAVGGVLVGTARECGVRVRDPEGHASRRHAQLERREGRWHVADCESRNGTWIDGARTSSAPLEPGAELGIGSLTLVAESERLIAVRGFLARILGWTSSRTVVVDEALRSIRLAARQRAGLVLSGDAELASIAQSLHRHVLGAAHPFVMCDPRRRVAEESTRAAANYTRGMDALAAARGGSLCVLGSRLPRDFAQVVRVLRNPHTRVQLVICASKRERSDGVLVAPIDIPPLASRSRELSRVVDEYALDALAELKAPKDAFTRHDHAWVMEHAATSLAEIEKATLRLAALRLCGGVTRAAALLDMAHVSLTRWIGRRQLPRQ